ncbi:hypothetical protein TNCV_5102281 [Trichonephila clavipes]|nr:hypothetical protein TNCV_5102281 [Trichonephila clavipes]
MAGARASMSLKISGRGSLMVKVNDSWLECHEFQPSTALQKGPFNVKSVEAQASSHWCHLGEGGASSGNKNAVYCGAAVCALLVTFSTLQHSARNPARDQQVSAAGVSLRSF